MGKEQTGQGRPRCARGRFRMERCTLPRIVGPTPATEAINWIYASYNRAKPNLKPGYDRDVRHPEWTERLLGALGRPDRHGYNVAVTGSKGKGSHAILLAGILQQLGLRVGLFTGPHLVDFMERIRVDGEMMPEPRFASCVRQIADIAARFELPDGQYLGPVGLLAAVAALWFREEDTDVNVYELGRGALHDDVNRVHHEGAVVAPVFLEHREQLGPRLSDVAWEKAGVITPETRWVVSHRQSDVPLSILRQQAVRQGADLQVLGEQVDCRATDGDKLVIVEVSGSRFEIRLPEPGGGFLVENAAVAMAAARAVWTRLRPGRPMPERIDLSGLRLPGRLEVVRPNPWVVVDGTIHGASARYVAAWSEARRARGGRIGAVLGLPADKDGEGVLAALHGTVDWLVFARAHNPHLYFDGRWAEMARTRWSDVHEAEYAEDALAWAEPRMGPRDVLLVLGTQSFVGDALAALGVDTTRIWRNEAPLPEVAARRGRA